MVGAESVNFKLFPVVNVSLLGVLNNFCLLISNILNHEGWISNFQIISSCECFFTGLIKQLLLIDFKQI